MARTVRSRTPRWVDASVLENLLELRRASAHGRGARGAASSDGSTWKQTWDADAGESVDTTTRAGDRGSPAPTTRGGTADGGKHLGAAGQGELLETADVLTGNDHLAGDQRPTDHDDVRIDRHRRAGEPWADAAGGPGACDGAGLAPLGVVGVLVCALWRTEFLLHAEAPSMVEPTGDVSWGEGCALMHPAAAYHGPCTRPPNEHATEQFFTSSGTRTLGTRVQHEVLLP